MRSFDAPAYWATTDHKKWRVVVVLWSNGNRRRIVRHEIYYIVARTQAGAERAAAELTEIPKRKHREIDARLATPADLGCVEEREAL